jgi:multidrug efflux pump subunit AcrA (membrane-fusion protein)
MINVVVEVDNPYARKPPLAVGLFVTVRIKGRVLDEATIIPRAALHQGNVVWVVDEAGRLRFREVRVARFSGDDVFIQSGLKDGEQLAISPLKAVTDGMAVRTIIVEKVDQS